MLVDVAESEKCRAVDAQKYQEEVAKKEVETATELLAEGVDATHAAACTAIRTEGGVVAGIQTPFGLYSDQTALTCKESQRDMTSQWTTELKQALNFLKDPASNLLGYIQAGIDCEKMKHLKEVLHEIMPNRVSKKRSRKRSRKNRAKRERELKNQALRKKEKQAKQEELQTKEENNKSMKSQKTAKVEETKESSLTGVAANGEKSSKADVAAKAEEAEASTVTVEFEIGSVNEDATECTVKVKLPSWVKVEFEKSSENGALVAAQSQENSTDHAVSSEETAASQPSLVPAEGENSTAESEEFFTIEVSVSIDALCEILEDPDTHLKKLSHTITEHDDWRKLSPAARNEKRYEVAKELAINSTRSDDERLSLDEIASKFGISVNTVRSILKQMEELTNLTREGFIEQKKGRKEANFKKVSEESYKKLREALHHLPSEYELNYTVWSGKCILQFLTEKCNESVTLRYVYYYLNKMNFKLKFASKLPHKQDEEEIRIYKNNLKSTLKQYLSEGFHIVFEDETHVQSDGRVRGFAFGNESPVVDHSPNIIKTKSSYVVFMGVRFFYMRECTGGVDSSLFLANLRTFLKKYPNDKFLIILDNAPTHTSDEVQEWLSTGIGKQRVRFLYLPKYAPKLNPVEFLNNDLKTFLRTSVCHTAKELCEKAREFRDKFVDKNGRVKPGAFRKIKKYFLAAECKYFIITYARIMRECIKNINLAKCILTKIGGVDLRDIILSIKNYAIGGLSMFDEKTRQTLRKSYKFLKRFEDRFEFITCRSR